MISGDANGRLYVNCCRTLYAHCCPNSASGKKCAASTTRRRPRVSRLPQSGVLPAQKFQELTEVAQALDPIRLFQQLEQLHQAVFHCAVNCSLFVPSTTPAPIRVFSVEHCTAGNVPAERSAPSYLTQCSNPLRFRTSAHLSKWPSGILPREDVRKQALLHSTQ